MEETIPAFSMWKMLNETVPVLTKTKGDCSDASVKKLATIIQSKESTSIFICYKDPTLTFQQYHEIESRYKAFTTWILGQLFYLLGCEKLAKLHNLIIDAQMCVLDQLSKTQLHVYQDLSKEYSKAFCELIRYFENSDDNFTLQVFIPEYLPDLNCNLNLNQVFLEVNSKTKCIALLEKLVKIIKHFVVENFTFYSFDENTLKNLDGLLLLLINADNDLKMDVLEIFGQILKNSKHKFDKYNVEIRNRFFQFSSAFEQIVYKLYDSQIVLKEQAFKKFEELLTFYLEEKELKNCFNNIQRISDYIVKKSLVRISVNLSPSEQVLLASMEHLNMLHFENLLELVDNLNFSNCFLIYCFQHRISKDVIEHEDRSSEIKIYCENVSPVWNQVYKKILDNLNDICGETCTFKKCLAFLKQTTNVLLKIRLEVLSTKENLVLLNFIEESKFFHLFITNFLNHMNRCSRIEEVTEDVLQTFIPFTLISNSKNVEIIFNILSYSLLKTVCRRNENQFTDNFISDGATADIKASIRQFYKFISSHEISKNYSILCLQEFFDVLSSGLISINSSQIETIEASYVQLCRHILQSGDHILTLRMIETIPNILLLFENCDIILTEIWNEALTSQNKKVLEKAIQVLPNISCCINSDFIKVFEWDKDRQKIKTHIICKKCVIGNKEDKHSEKIRLQQEFGSNVASINFSKIRVDQPFNSCMLKHVLTFISNSSLNLKLRALEALPSLSNHVLQFHSAAAIKMWVKLAEDQDKNVRKKFTQIIGPVIKYGQENPLISQDIKIEALDIIFNYLLGLTKKSLKHSDFDLQYSILTIIEEITSVKSELVTAELMKILFYFIMVPTSKHYLIAINKCLNLAKVNATSTMTIYSQNKKEFCEVIAHLCCVNQALINYSLLISLEKVSLMLGFYGSKNFVAQECNYLLPFFVSKIFTMPSVATLIQEMAGMLDMDISDLLTCKYGYIFVHIYLEMPTEEFKSCLQYLEKTTGVSGPSLRNRNFKIILNELLLNFHEKRDRVTLALKLLANEETDNKASSIPDYLQSHFLGVLLNFDVKLISKNLKKNKFLLSLAALFKYMGPKHIMPLRFKIIAMLQTTNYEEFPELNCEVWSAFIHTCEIESLAPQLATIFVSILPLLEYCPREINNIFKYLIVENEKYVKNYICDLFFVNNTNIDYEVLTVIRKCLKGLENSTLKQKIQRFLKYLTHEALEVRIQSLKHLKGFLEERREELDKMILDYNGIDSTIVELIDILTLGCREKDKTLKLACGEVISELGAIEPSHLPRRYNEDSTSFSFYINEDSFIISCLNELLKALQTEKNTQNMDRYSLAIQEILKQYEISPDNGMKKHYLWNEFPESHKEVMLPLLSSKYMIAQAGLTKIASTPIYGSNSGASFQSWLYNWTCSLISALPNEKKDHLMVCLPSMKQNNKILMHFLPYILLHVLLEGTDNITEKSFIEIQTITNSFTKSKTLDSKILNLRPIPISGLAINSQTVTPEELKQMQCTKIVFLLIDFLDRWVREWQWQKSLTGASDVHFDTINNFLKRLSKLQLAKCNYHCGEYPRALMCLEDYISEHKSEMSNHLSFLAEIYAQLEEPDGVDGATALQDNEPSIEEKILALEVSGKLADAVTCYERMLQPLKIHHIQGLVQCYLDLDNVNTALNFVRGAFDKQPEFGNTLLELQAEPLWRLGQYDELDSLLKKPDLAKNKSWGVQIGKALLSFKNGQRDEFHSVLNVLLQEQVDSFGAASLEEGAYQHGYGYISKLHALNELQQVEKIVNELLLRPNDNKFAENLIEKLTNEWSLRLKIVQESVRTIEPLLCVRRVALNLAKKIAEEKFRGAVPLLDSLVGECWLLSAKAARAAGMHQQAYTYTIKAEEYAPSQLFLEKAKLHWLREEHEQALTTLKRGSELILPEGNSLGDLSKEKRKICAEARLLIAIYNEEISNMDSEMNRRQYKKAVEVFPEWEKSMVFVAQYYDKIFHTFSEADKDSKGSELQLQMINLFGKSLQYGTTYIYQSMPRLLSIWFEYGTRLLDIRESSVREERKTTLMKMIGIIDAFLDRLPTYVFLTAFSQLISRICHPQKEVYALLKNIIVKLLQQYPQQSLWMIISVVKSSYQVRSKRCAEILCNARLKTTSFIKLVKDFTSLAEKLIELCNKDIPTDVTTVSVNSLLRSLVRLLDKDDFSEIMMPTCKFRKLILPNPDFSTSQHNPFPNQYVHIVRIEDELTVLNSLQRPRRITLRGSDGKRYIYMLKPKDDLRKDFRLMEFNDIVNQLLARDGDARQRRLNIRLYSVAPLNEECGLIEWVPNLIGLRPVLMSLYKQRGLAMKGRELKEACCGIKEPLDKKREVFLRKLLPKHPPILNEWFRKTFPDAQSWLTARTGYIRTTAVMSMAGYILGLGDRHGENISLDATCGDVVHVDFNCLFNKGEKFDYPERVPFRLTQNMVAAMGPLGVEGMFRKSCACSLRVLRTNTNTLMSVVTPFVYDPLVSWTKNIPGGSNASAERTNEEAVDHIKNIELRLQGRVKIKHSPTLLKPLSVEGQTNYLINEAVSIDNLCQMYIGWGPYL